MTFEQFAELCRDWMKRLPPAEARSAIESILPIAVANPREVNLDDLLAMVAKWQPAPTPERRADEAVAAPKRQPRKSKKAKSGTGQAVRGRPPVKRAQVLVRQQLANGPRRGEDVQAAAEAADISERSLIAAADALGVRARRGQWWLPGRIDRNGAERSA